METIPQIQNVEQVQRKAFVDKVSVSLAELAQGSKSKEKVEKNLQEACLDLLSSEKLLAPFVKNLQERHGKQYSDAKEISRDFAKLLTESFKLTSNNKMDTNQYCQLYLQKAIEIGILPRNYNYYGNGNDPIVVRGIIDTAYNLWQAVVSVAEV
ncbi:hypothetical protein [Helicobacter suis]|uniref:hypothetical protein n=1 Tax=Helicobacter suis TaxID=104628 RepID=UPI001597841B|nr:hypothetical protein [Helicobacter suis]BCD51311.1 hypothetical protein NHP194022_09820 [Helicobacter suis]